MAGIVVVGSINADLVAQVERHPKPGETLLGSGGHITAGGKGANQAVAAALQGAPVSFIGATGQDAYTDPALEYLRTAGVDLSAVASTSEATGLAIITVDATGENSIVVIPGANATVGADYVRRHADVIARADILLLQGEIPADGIEAAITIAQENQVRVVINLAPVIAMDPQLLKAANPLIANEHEAALILEMLGVAVSDETPEGLCASLQDQGFASVVLTLGSKGCLVAEDSLQALDAHKVKAVDTTGAGDAFAGGLVAKLRSGSSLLEAAEFATAVSAAAVQRPGAQASYSRID